MRRLALHRLDRLTASPRSVACLVLISLTALLATFVGTPAWAPEDPWRLVAEVPVVRGSEPSTPELVARFLDEHDVRLSPAKVFAIADAVAEESRRHRIDPALLLAVICSESGFRTDAVSEKGAIGLMQLLPSTAQEVSDDLELEWGGEVRLLDPEVNIALGSFYLRRLIDTFDGDLSLALTAYNKGPGYVQAMQASGLMESTPSSFPSAYAEKVVTRMAAVARSARNRHPQNLAL